MITECLNYALIYISIISSDYWYARLVSTIENTDFKIKDSATISWQVDSQTSSFIGFLLEILDLLNKEAVHHIKEVVHRLNNYFHTDMIHLNKLIGPFKN
jgi:hypothetical protein